MTQAVVEWLIRSPLSGVKVKKRKRKAKKVISAETWVGRQLAALQTGDEGRRLVGMGGGGWGGGGPSGLQGAEQQGAGKDGEGQRGGGQHQSGEQEQGGEQQQGGEQEQGGEQKRDEDSEQTGYIRSIRRDDDDDLKGVVVLGRDVL